MSPNKTSDDIMAGDLPTSAQLSVEIFFKIVEFVDAQKDLLALALTSRALCEMTIPRYLHSFQIRGQVTDTLLWNDLLQRLHLCKNVREFELGSNVHRTCRITSLDNNHVQARSWNSFTGKAGSPDVSSLCQVVESMIGLRRAKFGITNVNVFQHIFNALVASRCNLEELDITLNLQTQRHVLRALLPHDGTPLTNEANLSTLQIWSKLDVTSLRKISVQFGIKGFPNNVTLSSTQEIVNMLSNARGLTHLRLSSISTSSISLPTLFDCTWPNLESIIISDIICSMAITAHDPDSHDQNTTESKLRNFLKRHSKLTHVSLSYDDHLPNSSPLVDVTDLPNLRSFSNPTLVRVPLSMLVTPALARTLRHLTIGEEDSALLLSNRNIYKELVSLRTCCITAGRSFTDYQKVNRILEHFVAHVTNLEKIHLPTCWRNSKSTDLYLFETISLLQCLPNLTHLSGLIWTGAPSLGDPHSERLLSELSNFFRLGYVISPPSRAVHRAQDANVNIFRLVRDTKKSNLDVELVCDPETVQGCDAALWGGFYRGIEF